MGGEREREREKEQFYKNSKMNFSAGNYRNESNFFVRIIFNYDRNLENLPLRRLRIKDIHA